jgi:hypothetical protein
MRVTVAFASIMLTISMLIPRVGLTSDLFVCHNTCAYRTIQDAVNAGVSGDVIHIAPGQYVENVTIAGKALKLIGAAGGTGGVTEVYAAGRGPVFTLGSGVDDSYHLIEIDHLTISHGDHESGTGVGGGVQVRRGAYLHLSNSILTQNTAWFGGGLGVNTPGGPATTVKNCLIDDDAAVLKGVSTGDSGWGGGVVVIGNSKAAIQLSSIVRNHALDGGGVYTDAGSQVTVDLSTISENGASQVHQHLGFIGGTGGGLRVNSDVVVSNSTISDNSATGPESPSGGGLFVLVAGDRQTIVRTVIDHNTADGGPGSGGDGGGVFSAGVNRTARLALDHVYVVENQASQGGAGGISNSATLVLTDTTIKDNSGLNCTGGIGCPP